MRSLAPGSHFGQADEEGVGPTSAGSERPNHDSFVFERLFDEFGDRIDLGTIHEIAAQELAALAVVKIHDFVPIFALRKARARLIQRSSLGRGA